MTNPTGADNAQVQDDTYRRAREATGKIFEDLRDRRFLKWLFVERPEEHMTICHIAKAPLTITPAAQPYLEPLEPLDSEVQSGIRDAWSEIIATALREAEQRGMRRGAEIVRGKIMERHMTPYEALRDAAQAIERAATQKED